MPVLTEADATRDHAAAVQTDVAMRGKIHDRARDGVLDHWACGIADDAEAGDDHRCNDIIPELILELI